VKFDGIEALGRTVDDDSANARAALGGAPDAFPRLGEVALVDRSSHRSPISRLAVVSFRQFSAKVAGPDSLDPAGRAEYRCAAVDR
jgi:hypothetical protein